MDDDVNNYDRYDVPVLNNKCTQEEISTARKVLKRNKSPIDLIKNRFTISTRDTVERHY